MAIKKKMMAIKKRKEKKRIGTRHFLDGLSSTRMLFYGEPLWVEGAF